MYAIIYHLYFQTVCQKLFQSSVWGRGSQEVRHFLRRDDMFLLQIGVYQLHIMGVTTSQTCAINTWGLKYDMLATWQSKSRVLQRIGNRLAILKHSAIHVFGVFKTIHTSKSA